MKPHYWLSLGLLIFAHVGLAGSSNQIIRTGPAGAFCIDVKDAKSKIGQPILGWTCHGLKSQRWTIPVLAKKDPSTYLLGLDGFCLESHPKAAHGAQLTIAACSFGGNQRFELTSDGHLKDKTSGKCVTLADDKNASEIILDDCRNAKVSRWTLADSL